MQGSPERISTGSPLDLLKDLYETMQGHLGPTGLAQDPAKASESIPRGSPKDLHTRNCKRPFLCQDPNKILIKGPAAAAAAGEALTRSSEELLCKHL